MHSITFDDLDYLLSPTQKDPEVQQLISTIRTRGYAKIYALLNKRTAPFDPEAAFWLCYYALDCSINVLTRLLPLCPPPDSFIHKHTISTMFELPNPGLLGFAAYHDRSEAVSLFLQAGASPNAAHSDQVSPLEMAMEGHSFLTLDLLLKQPGLDKTITPRLLDIWARLDESAEDPSLLWCCQRLAQETFAPDYDIFDPTPLPPQLTIRHAAYYHNWPLFRRLCRERPLTTDQAVEGLQNLISASPSLEEAAPLLFELLEACPELVRRRMPRYLLAALALSDSPLIDRAAVQHWLDRLPGKEIVLQPSLYPERILDVPDLLQKWSRRLGDRFLPVLDTAYPLPGNHPGDQQILALLNGCRITGRRCTKNISALSTSILYHASPSLLCYLLQSDNVLARETPEAIQRFLECPVIRSEKADLLRAHIRKEEPYAL